MATRSHIWKGPHFGLGRHRYDPDLDWLLCASDAACGLRSHMGGQLDVLNIGVTLHPPAHEPAFDLAAAARLRRVVARWKLLSHLHQTVLTLWYTRREMNGKAPVSEIEVAAAHKAWREV